MSALHAVATAKIASSLHKLGLLTQSQTLSAGRMPSFSLFLPPSTSTSTSPSKLRLVLTSNRLGANSPALSSALCFELRIFTRRQVVYALTAPNVARAVSQTHVFDYRREEGAGHSRFGRPLRCVEVRVVGADNKVSEPVGELVVAGPAVAGGE